MKKHLIATAVILLLMAAPHAFAQFVPLVPKGIPGLTDLQPSGQDTLVTFFNNLYKYLIGVAAALAIIMIIWGGLEYSTQDSVSKKSDGKKRIYAAIFGLVLVLAPVLIFSVINPSILNLSIGLKPIDMGTGGSIGGGGGGGGGDGGGDDSGCTSITGMAGILQIAVCPTKEAAGKWAQKCTDGTTAFTQIKDPATGIVKNVETCSGSQEYVFIHNESFFKFPINSLMPLESYDNRPNQGTAAISFAAICNGVNLDLQTCISDDAVFSFPVPCNLTGPNSATSWKCYKEHLSCRDAWTMNIYCSKSPSWTIFK